MGILFLPCRIGFTKGKRVRSNFEICKIRDGTIQFSSSFLVHRSEMAVSYSSRDRVSANAEGEVSEGPRDDDPVEIIKNFAFLRLDGN